MKRLALVLIASIGCVDGLDADEQMAGVAEDETVEQPDPSLRTTEMPEPSPHDLEPTIDALGTKCGMPAPSLLETAWIWGSNGIPVGLQVELDEPVEKLTVEFWILNGARIDDVAVHRTTVEGTQVFELPAQMLEDAADFASEGGAPFGRVSATVTAHNSAGGAIGTGDGSAVHFKRDQFGTLLGFSPVAAAMDPALRDAYPEIIVVDGVEQENTYVRVFRSNPGEE